MEVAILTGLRILSETSEFVDHDSNHHFSVCCEETKNVGGNLLVLKLVAMVAWDCQQRLGH